ncbi:MAG: hypothetical protein OXE74_06985, partial [Cyanobacteria bacterium MAG CAR2_bin_4]|nr:hypothetical protein [Cyanobacteria bacterium MAG CAR2_bin_4]
MGGKGKADAPSGKDPHNAQVHLLLHIYGLSVVVCGNNVAKLKIKAAGAKLHKMTTTECCILYVV